MSCFCIIFEQVKRGSYSRNLFTRNVAFEIKNLLNKRVCPSKMERSEKSWKLSQNSQNYPFQLFCRLVLSLHSLPIEFLTIDKHLTVFCIRKTASSCLKYYLKAVAICIHVFILPLFFFFFSIRAIPYIFFFFALFIHYFQKQPIQKN